MRVINVTSCQINHTHHKTNQHTAGSNTEFECNKKYDLMVLRDTVLFLKVRKSSAIAICKQLFYYIPRNFNNFPFNIDVLSNILGY